MRSLFVSAISISVMIFVGGVFAADFNGDGTNDIGIFRASTGLWSVFNLTRFFLGSGSDRAVPGDYNGDGTVEGAIFRSGDGLWSVRNVTRVYMGTGYDDPLPGVLGNLGGGGGGGYWQGSASEANDIYFVPAEGKGEVGIGIDNPINKLHVVGTADYALVKLVNQNAGEDADGISIELPIATPVASNRYIGFWGNDAYVGSICGNGSGGVSYTSAGSDFAEYLPRLHRDEAMEAGDIVGIVDGKITKAAPGAEQFQVLSSAPIVLGNDPGTARRDNCEQVALIGHAPTKVEGPIQAGDYIIPSGRGDGIGVAVSPDQITLSQCGKIVGRAVESNERTEVKLVNAAVGVNVAAPIVGKLGQEKDNRIESLSRRLEALEAKITRIENGK